MITVMPVSYTHLDVYKRQEQDTIRGELFTGSVVTAAQSFLKLGIATTVLTGVTLMSRGDLALIRCV